MDGLLEAVEQAYREFQQGTTTVHPILPLRLADPARQVGLLPITASATGPTVRVYPPSGSGDPAADSRLLLLFDPNSGGLLAVIANDELNPVRTGAAAGVAARYLAPPAPRAIGLIGSGKQARGQLLALHRALPSVDQVRVFSPTPAHREAFAREMTAWLGIAVEAVDSAAEAVAGAPVVDLATSGRVPVVEADWLMPGALVIAMAPAQVPPAQFARARLFVSWREGFLNDDRWRAPYEALIRAGTWSPDRIVGQFGEVVLGTLPARRDPSEVVVYEMPALGAWDAAVAAWVHRWAVERGIGTAVPLFAPPAHPAPRA
jgi:ornithine cyclodeaminase/alanine dehydrogenase-like protein (mu-crystallin family)